MPARTIGQAGLRAGAALTLALLASGCAGGGRYGNPYAGPVPYDGTDPAAGHSGRLRAPSRYYPPPGPASDPWGPYIREASSTYRVPEQWIRAVMHQESGGHEQAVSPVGAMGLMQVMPGTYRDLKSRHRGLGEDPYDPHNNISAGVAYIREMYDKYGSPGFLAAYNAGPDRLDQYLAGSSPLPDETVNYLAAISPNLGGAVPPSGPLVQYASAAVPVRAAASSASFAPSSVSFASGCDPNAAYDPDRPCARLERAATAPTLAPRVLAPPTLPSVRTVAVLSAAGGGWGVQVGAFRSEGLARAVAEGARAEAPDQLRGATITLPPTTPFGGAALYRARLSNLSAGAAQSACDHLNQHQLPCVVVRPEQS